MPTDEKWTKVTKSYPGYKHTQIYGECGKDVTVEDIKKQYYHPYFGGRNAWISDGKFGVIMHDD